MKHTSDPLSLSSSVCLSSVCVFSVCVSSVCVSSVCLLCVCLLSTCSLSQADEGICSLREVTEKTKHRGTEREGRFYFVMCRWMKFQAHGEERQNRERESYGISCARVLLSLCVCSLSLRWMKPKHFRPWRRERQRRMRKSRHLRNRKERRGRKRRTHIRRRNHA